MQPQRFTGLLTKTIGFTVLSYGLAIITTTLIRQLRLRIGHDVDAIIVSLPLLIGISYVYLGNQLLRRKQNAWWTAVALSIITLVLNGLQLIHALRLDVDTQMTRSWARVVVPILILVMLLLSRANFRVKSDNLSFRQAMQTSILLLLAAFLYGVGGFMFLSSRDFHQHIHLATAAHQTIDQFGLTTNPVVAHSRRARLFLDSLPVISISAVAYAVISFFQPLRARFVHRAEHRADAERLLKEHESDIDDFFKLWPHDKLYFFNQDVTAGVAYHVSRGVALVVGDPFGNPRAFTKLLKSFHELCFVNDWLPAYIHVGLRHRKLYERFDYNVQKIGEEAIVDLAAFQAEPLSKYFRQIRNRFDRLNYQVELLTPPHTEAVLSRMQAISDEWLKRPGREERGFMLGYFSRPYLQSCTAAVLKNEHGQIEGFMNLIPTYVNGAANYDLLRCSESAPGNANDFLVLNVIRLLSEQGYTHLNLGLCPLAGLDKEASDASLIDSTLRFVYANGDRLYSFSGLQRFKAKYEPSWEARFIAYPGGLRNFTRILTALNRAMKVK